MEGSSRFGLVRLRRTSSNHFHEGGSRPAGQVQVSMGWFDHTKPPRTTFILRKQDYRAVSSEFGVVRPHRTSSNHCDSGRKGSLESVRGGSTVPNLLKPL